MQKLKNKSMAILIAAILTISIGASAMLVQAVSLAPGKVDIPTYTFCSVSPNPVGEGQTVNVNFWVNEPPPTASAQYGDRWHNMTVVVTTPGGTTTTLGPFISDDTGGTHTTYTPAVTGNYTFELFFGGQLLTGVNLPRGYSGQFREYWRLLRTQPQRCIYAYSAIYANSSCTFKFASNKLLDTPD